ncbi:MAG TPA: disulfide bond formation protein DsbA [Dysgonomonas sp.]|nr:disulfide bond formation protein DsbA [Dysgonomonas sp.]
MSLRVPVTDKDHVQGSPDASIELVEYGDYQCPYCGKAYYEVKKIQEEMGGNLKFVFRNFPLISIHKHALNAAVAAEAAGDMGKYWEMHDIIFENQQALDDADLVKYAGEIGLDEEEFKSMFSDKKYEAKIEKELEGGLRSGVNGTPSFFINGKKYEGEYSAKVMIEHLQSL